MIRKVFIANIVLAVIAIVLYSPGLLNLRPWDDSILRAALSISLGVLLVGLLVVNNMRLLEKTPKKTDGLKDAVRVLQEYGLKGRNDYPEAKQALAQEKRLRETLEDLEFLIGDRFGKGSISYQKFDGARAGISKVVGDNLISVANRILLFSENEKNDEELKMKNHQEMEHLLSQNEQLLKQGNRLALELAAGEENQDVLEEITKLTEEVKFYQ